MKCAATTRLGSKLLRCGRQEGHKGDHKTRPRTLIGHDRVKTSGLVWPVR